ncbi:putative het domain-containing protein [Eutypa lata UCREL1]|uniref:Putative het domain-containing protein n=1 Tax=Eutypa lata (strain UCR-EL1) TaxID=1287681 RepID=M7STN0_EUTLA|nr:putative het domain-containing protein [Eutypa lata UCREL1]
MRLLHAKTHRLLEFPFNEHIPEYAILSHTWGANGDEVTLKDFHSWTPWFKRKPGWAKIKGCCRQALTDGLEYVWIDTCCIDRSKTAPPETVGDEIQLIWQYYTRARVCYVHLADVHDTPKTNPESPGSAFRRSRWFTRGWTVPEMLAPFFVRFYDASWKYVGSKAELSNVVEEVTGIDAPAVRDPNEVGRRSVACRMSWVAARETSREEDLAYCLFGLFDLKTPVEYGEGRRNAFLRLQNEILRRSSIRDQSLFAWGYGLPLAGPHDDRKVGMLAETPAAFRHCGEVEPVGGSSEPAFEVTATGLQFQLPMQIDEATGTALLNLECRVGDYYLVLPLDRSPNGRGEFERRPYSKPMLVPISKLALFSVRTINTQLTNRPHSMSKYVEVSIEAPKDLSLELVEAYPPGALQDVRSATADLVERDSTLTFYLSDLPWTMLSVQSALGPKFLISLERGNSPTKTEARTVSTQLAEVPASRSLSGPLTAAAFSLLHLLPIFDSTPVVVWADGIDIGGLLVRSEFQMPGAGNDLRQVRIAVGTPGSRPLSSLSGAFKKGGKKGRKKK